MDGVKKNANQNKANLVSRPNQRLSLMLALLLVGDYLKDFYHIFRSFKSSWFNVYCEKM